MGIKLSNNASSRLAANLSVSDTSVVLASGGGAAFPALAAGDWFPATLVKMTGEFEIVKVTDLSGDALTKGGNGGKGGRAVRTFSYGENGNVAKGMTLTIVVGKGGSGGAGQVNGTAGTDGAVYISWT